MKKSITISITLFVLFACYYLATAANRNLAQIQESALQGRLVGVKCEPSTINVGQATKLIISVRSFTDASLMKESVNLLRFNEGGEFVASLGRLYDDGTHGDKASGDGFFSNEITLNEPQPGILYLQASAAYRGSPTRASSEFLPVPIQTRISAEDMLSKLADDILAGRIEAALKRFSPSPLNREILESLDGNLRNRLASALKAAKLIQAKDDSRTYQLTFSLPTQ